MNAEEFSKKLSELNACKDACDWAAGKSLQEIWDTCHRGDWMLWLYRRADNYNYQTLTLAKGHCANTVRHLMKDERSIKAVDAAIKFGEGNLSQEDLAAAYDAAYDAYDAAAYATAAYATAYATAYAAADAAAYDDATADAADAAADAADAAAYAADAAYAAAYAAAAAYDDATADAADAAAYAAAAAAARKNNQQLTAYICRKYLPLPEFKQSKL